MERELPIIKIEGTEFLLDVNRVVLQEKDSPENTISFFEMDDEGLGYSFEYSLQNRNMPGPWDKEADCTVIRLPQLVEMDPEGMAEKYGLAMTDLKGITDFDLMVDTAALEQRLKGRLTTIDIAGHTFYVDIPMDKLRPKDDFLSKGIVFNDVDHCYCEEEKVYTVPYNPAKREFQEPDYDSLTEFPKDLILVKFPNERILDPVGYNRKHGDDLLVGLKETSVRTHFTARIIDWKETGLQERIEDNLKRLAIDKQEKRHGQKISRPRKGKGI